MNIFSDVVIVPESIRLEPGRDKFVDQCIRFQPPVIYVACRQFDDDLQVLGVQLQSFEQVIENEALRTLDIDFNETDPSYIISPGERIFSKGNAGTSASFLNPRLATTVEAPRFHEGPRYSVIRADLFAAATLISRTFDRPLSFTFPSSTRKICGDASTATTTPAGATIGAASKV